MSLNVHHLELFYYVAKHRGITQAVRKMPWGIQQPAVSGQIKQLEESLGDTKLFHRRPFALTPAGAELYDFVAPFFSGLDQVEERLRGEGNEHLRLAASAAVMTSHLPEVLTIVRKQFPGLRLTLKETKTSEIESVLQKQEADIAITTLQKNTAPGIRSIKLLELPLLLLSPTNDQPFETFAQIRKTAAPDGIVKRPLISLAANDLLTRNFQQGLARREIQWETTVEISDLPLMPTYVTGGFGCAVTLEIPHWPTPSGVTSLRLPKKDFRPLVIGILHTGNLKPVAQHFIDVAKNYVSTHLSQ